MAKEDIILRSTVNAPLTTKGSALTHAQFDANWIEIYNALVSLSQSSYVTAYDAAITYDDTILNYVTYSSQIWKMINATPQVNVTPGTDANTWVKVYATDLVGKSPFLYETKLTLTADDVNGGLSAPITIISSPQSGFFLEPISGSVAFNYGTIPFDATEMYIAFDGVSSALATIQNIQGATSFFRLANTSAGDIVEATKIVASFDADGSSSPLGDSTIDIYLTYKITAI